MGLEETDDFLVLERVLEAFHENICGGGGVPADVVIAHPVDQLGASGCLCPHLPIDGSRRLAAEKTPRCRSGNPGQHCVRGEKEEGKSEEKTCSEEKSGFEKENRSW